DAEVVGCDPPAGRAVLHGEGLVEGRLEPIRGGHAEVQPGEVAGSRDDDFRRKRQRGDDDPRSNGAVVNAERSAARDIIIELPLHPVHPPLDPAWTVAGREAPAMLPVALELERV